MSAFEDNINSAMEDIADIQSQEEETPPEEGDEETTPVEEPEEEPEEEPQYEVDVQELNTTIETLRNELQTSKRDGQVLADRVQLLVNQGGKTQEEEPEATSNSNIEIPPDFDTMGQSEMVKWIVDTVSAQVNNQITPIKEELKTTKQEQKHNAVMSDLEQTAQKYSDFNTYVPQMQEIAKRIGPNTGLSAEEIYFIAKNKAVDSVQPKTTPSYLKPKKKQVVKKQAPANEKPSSSTETTRQESFSRGEAFEEAWSRVMEGRE